MLARLNTAFVALGGATNFGDFGIYAGFFEDLLPNLGGFGVFWDTVFFITNKASDVNFLWIEADDLC